MIVPEAVWSCLIVASSPDSFLFGLCNPEPIGMMQVLHESAPARGLNAISLPSCGTKIWRTIFFRGGFCFFLGSWFYAFLLLWFSDFLLLCNLLLCFSASLLFCFSVFPVSLLLYFCAFLLLLFYFFFFFSHVFLLLYFLLLCFFASCLYRLFFFIFFCFILSCLYPKWNPRETLGETQRNPKEILIRHYMKP